MFNDAVYVCVCERYRYISVSRPQTCIIKSDEERKEEEEEGKKVEKSDQTEKMNEFFTLSALHP